MKRDITICLAYYENPGMLEYQLGAFATMGAKVRKHLRVIVVDDGSPVHAASEHVPSAYHEGGLGFDFKLYRMEVDVAWNQDACRNLAVLQAFSEWVLLTDIDHLVPEQTLIACISGDLDASCAYRFSRVTAPEMEPYKPHPNSWLLTRALYDRVGGYDERYAGIYGTDGMFMAGIAREASRIVDLPEILIRCPREYIPDASTTTLTRKSPENSIRKRAKDVEIAKAVSEASRPVRGRFPWKRVL